MRASERAYQFLRSDIIEWHLEPGTTLNEVEQAERLGVSRTPVREAFSRLMSDGLVEPSCGRGVIVTPVSVTNVRAMFELRTALETQAAALAAVKGDPEAFDALAHRLEEAAVFLVDDDADRSSYYLLVEEMDAEIDRAAQNTYLAQAQRQLRTHLGRVRKLSKGNEGRLMAAAHEHAAIARAIAEGDVELAQAAIRVHLSNALKAILDAVPDQEGERESAA
ncbi:GntR family transcriptional regulator [Rothia uropygialis]|uniref:GntR family transcriptional regulator n=1 Tax=Kocuria sp. 36 TaxID=1415402 RepID=UPI00101C92B6|nr:GntR family transcriptional regulator [Kocuria sp. 36]